MMHCSTERPWGVHAFVRNDENCPRCGWVAPGPKGDAAADAVYDAQEREWIQARTAELGWVLLEGTPDDRLAA